MDTPPKSMNRRQFIKIVGAGAALVALGNCSGESDPPGTGGNSDASSSSDGASSSSEGTSSSSGGASSSSSRGASSSSSRGASSSSSREASSSSEGTSSSSSPSVPINGPEAEMYNLTPGSTIAAINVSWYSGSAGNKSSVRLYDANGTLVKTVTGTSGSATTGKRWHKATVDGLAPGAKYKLSVSSDDTEWSKGYDYSAPPAGDFKFAVIADPHLSYGTDDFGPTLPTWSDSVAKIAASAGVTFIVSVGDQVDEFQGSKEDEYELFFTPPALRNIPLAPSLGNHDISAVFGHHFNLPNEQPRASFDSSGSTSYWNYTKYNYFYLYNNILFVGLNTGACNTTACNPPANLTKNLVDNFGAVIDVAKSANAGKYDWIVVQHHKSTRSAGAHAADVDVAAYAEAGFETLMTQKGVDVVLAGHDHIYVRTKPINNVTYFTFLPAAHSKFYYVEANKDFIAKSYSYKRTNSSPFYAFRPAYTIVDVSGRSMTFKTQDLDNILIDEFTITK